MKRKFEKLISLLNFTNSIIHKYIGKRIFKTALAVALTLHLSFPDSDVTYFAPLAAIVTMQSSVLDSIEAGKNRMFSTIIGLLVALSFHLIEFQGAIAVFIGIILTIKICTLLKWEKTVSLACIVFLSVIVFDKGDDNFFIAIEYGIKIIAETSIGIIVALLVNKYILPPKEPKIVKNVPN